MYIKVEKSHNPSTWESKTADQEFEEAFDYRTNQIPGRPGVVRLSLQKYQ